MGKKLFRIMTLVLSIAVIGLAACKKDKCKDKNCGSGSCVDGNCVCNTGYEGSACDVQVRAKFIGLYQGNLACSGFPSFAMNVTITNSSAGITSIVMSDGTDSWVAVVSGSTLTIANQSLSGGGTIQGSGALAGNILTLNLNISGTTCTYTGTKQ